MGHSALLVHKWRKHEEQTATGNQQLALMLAIMQLARDLHKLNWQYSKDKK